MIHYTLYIYIHTYQIWTWWIPMNQPLKMVMFHFAKRHPDGQSQGARSEGRCSGAPRWRRRSRPGKNMRCAVVTFLAVSMMSCILTSQLNTCVMFRRGALFFHGHVTLGSKFSVIICFLWVWINQTMTLMTWGVSIGKQICLAGKSLN